jgi:hypothetical protein
MRSKASASDRASSPARAAYVAQTRIAEGKRYLGAALEAQLALYGEEHPETARTLAALARAEATEGDYDAAAEAARRSVAAYRALRAEGRAGDDGEMAEVLAVYGDILWTKASTARRTPSTARGSRWSRGRGPPSRS